MKILSKVPLLASLIAAGAQFGYSETDAAEARPFPIKPIEDPDEPKVKRSRHSRRASQNIHRIVKIRGSTKFDLKFGRRGLADMLAARRQAVS